MEPISHQDHSDAYHDVQLG